MLFGVQLPPCAAQFCLWHREGAHPGRSKLVDGRLRSWLGFVLLLCSSARESSVLDYLKGLLGNSEGPGKEQGGLASQQIKRR